MSPNSEWYGLIEIAVTDEPKKFVWFWQKKNDTPITQSDQGMGGR